MKNWLLLLVFINLATISCTNLNSYPGYKTLKTEKVDSISSELVELVHEKSGASIVLIKNSDPAISFMVGFKTPPYDDTGLFHIFEHAVLEGSRFYPSKSNFFHLANSSVASFINAMTSSVNTLYPFVTRSQKDFDNLLPVYLDAVFFPSVLKDPRIISREGWRYEVNPETKKMSINGIVLSEMKGAFSSPYRSLWYQVSKGLLPDTPFAYSSGGLPEKVATLTFEQIVEAHKKYYHPQNSVIYLYGDVDYKKALKTIDKDFLSHFQREQNFKSPDIPTQTNFDYSTPLVQATYPGEKGAQKDFISYGMVIGTQLTPVEKNVLNVLVSAFIDNDASPLKLRLLKEGLAQSAFSMNVGGNDNGLAFVLEGSDLAQLEKIKTVIDEELQRVVQEGIDPELLNSILNKYEFSFKEKNSNGSHRGLQMAFLVLENWTYQNQPLKKDLDFVTQFKELRKALADQDYIKSFFKKNFLENSKKRWVVLQPDPEFSQKFNAGLDRQIEQALKDKPIDEYLKEQKEYEEWVAAKESDEILSKTPTLKISDINDDEKPIPSTTTRLGQTELIMYPQNTSGISYVNLYFDLTGISQERLKNLELFQQLIRKTDTKNIGFKELSKQIDTSIGGLGFAVRSYQSTKDPQKFKPTLEVGLSFLLENREKTFSLLKEILTASQFTPIDRVDNLIKEMKTSMASSISNRAPGLSASAATKSFFPQLGSFNDEISGASFENYIAQNQIKPDALSTEMQALLKDIFNQNRLFLATVTADQTDLNQLKTDLSSLREALPAEGSTDQVWDFSKQVNFDGFIIPGEVQYVSQASSFSKHMPYHGSMLVYSRYLNNNYMTPKLREQAGAYGGGATFSRNGLFTMTTYRDPNLQKSLEIFSKALDFMKSEKFTADKLRPAILGSLKPYYSDKSVADKSNFMTTLYLTEQTWDDYLKLKKEILSTDAKNIEAITTALEKSLDQLQKAVAGNAQKIKSEGTFLKNTLVIK